MAKRSGMGIIANDFTKVPVRLSQLVTGFDTVRGDSGS
jgi:hypothetical protein